MIKPIHLFRDFNCSSSKLFEILINQEKLTSALQDESFIESRLDGKVSLFGDWTTGKVLEINGPSHIKFTWNASDFPADQGETIVEFKITDNNSNCQLELIHTGFTNQTQRDSHETGWDDHFFNGIKELIF